MNVYFIYTAIGLGFIHVLLGFDHYIPFIFLSKAEKWNDKKTFIIVFLSGLFHVLSSIFIGFVGLYLKNNLFFIKQLELSRGELAGWLLIVFGILYIIFSIKKINRKLLNLDKSSDIKGNTIANLIRSHPKSYFFIILIFVLGPCEPLIPLMLYPHKSSETFLWIISIFLFSFTTIITMLIAVFIGRKILTLIKNPKFSNSLPTITGAIIALCGIAVTFFNV